MNLEIVIICSGILFFTLYFVIRHFCKQDNNIFKHTWKDNIIALGLMFTSITIGVYKIGEHYNHGVWYGDQHGKLLQLNFTKPQAVKNIKIYGCIVNGSFSINYLDIRGKGGTLQNIDNTKNPKTVCTWSSYLTHLSQPLVSINLVINKPLLEVMKIYIESYNGDPIINYIPSAKMDPKLDEMSGIFFNDKLSSPDFKNTGMVFDENDYALMAYHYLQSVPIFNLSHPQLGILMMIPAIKYFGMNPFSWRLFSLICGSFVVGVIYFLAKELFRSRGAGILAAVLLILDFMHFTINRIAIIEPYVTLFIVIEFYCLWQYHCSRLYNVKRAHFYLFLAGIFLGFSIASKWSGLFSLPAILSIVMYDEYRCRKQFGFGKFIYLLIILVILPVLIYIISYIPFIMISQSNRILETIWYIQKEMFKIHTQLAVTDFIDGQPWWSWPINRYLMAIYYRMNFKSGLATSMVFMGNPFIWWLGIIAVIMMLFSMYKKHTSVCAFILLGIITQYLPYVFMKRVSFIYYFYSVTPFWILALTWLLYEGWKRPERSIKYYIVAYLVACLTVFIVFYPVIAGIEVHRAYIFKYLLWFDSWKF